MNASDISIAFIHYPRTPNYLPETLASLFASGPEIHAAAPVHIMAGSLDSSDLRNLGHHQRAVRVHLMGSLPGDDVFDEGWYGHRRQSFNICRALALPVRRGLLLCEDDVVFCDGFLSRLLATVEEVERHGNESYALSLASINDDFGEPHVRGERYTAYPREVFSCIWAMYYPAAVLAELREYVWKHGAEQNRLPADLLVGELLGNRMLASRPALAQHIGVVSLLSEGDRHSPSFARVFGGG